MNQVAAKIASEIQNQGAIPFARFMELALYCPIHGFYEKKEDSIGAGGDYYTSVSVGSLFGELLAWQFAQWLVEPLKPPGRGPDAAVGGVPGSSAFQEPDSGSGALRLVEAGAHRGELARDILHWFRQERPRLFQDLEYWLVEPSPLRQAWQRQTLEQFGAQVRWVSTLSELQRESAASTQSTQASGLRGILFSNELLDAMPVRRWGWDARVGRWFEWGVTLKGGRFAWARLQAATRGPDSESGPGLPLRLSSTQPSKLKSQVSTLEASLPDGFTVETNEAATAWWRDAARVLERGRLLTLDYGLTGEELFVPERSGGTLRAYRRHQVSHELLACPGEQDLTAHVNFTAIQEAGQAAGLSTETLTTQEQFLTRLAARICHGEAPFGEWTQARTRQLQRLTHPEHLGRAFKALVQRRP